MATLYASRVQIIDSGSILAVFQDGDISSVDFSITNNTTRVQGMSFNTRGTTGFVLANYEISFSFNALVRIQQSFIDMFGDWNNANGYTNNISVTFNTAYPQTANGLAIQNFITFNNVVPSDQSGSASSPSTEMTTQYQYMAQDYSVG